MANSPDIIQRSVTVLEPRIVLELTPKQAVALHLITGMIGGDYQDSLRKETNEIYYALNECGLDSTLLVTTVRGTLYCESNPEQIDRVVREATDALNARGPQYEENGEVEV